MNWITTLAQLETESGAAGGIVGGLIFCVFALIGLALFVFWIWMLVDAIRNNGLGDTEKIVWVLVIVLTSWLGAIIYYFVGKPKHNPAGTAATTTHTPPPAA